jgi:hypothetical protein
MEERGVNGRVVRFRNDSLIAGPMQCLGSLPDHLVRDWRV